MNVLPLEQVDERSRCEHSRLRRGEPGQVAVARDQHVSATCDRERDEVVVLRIGSGARDGRGVVDENGRLEQFLDEPLGSPRRDRVREPRPADHARQLLEESRRDDELESPLEPEVDNLRRRTGTGDEAGYEDARIDDGARHLRRRLIPFAPHRVQLGVGELERLFFGEVAPGANALDQPRER